MKEAADYSTATFMDCLGKTLETRNVRVPSIHHRQGVVDPWSKCDKAGSRRSSVVSKPSMSQMKGSLRGGTL